MSFSLVERVTFAYGRAGQPVLSNLRGTLPHGTTAVMGVSGVGKSTLLNLLGLLWEDPLQHGDIIYHAPGGPRAYATLNSNQRAEMRRTEFGFVPQSSFLLPHLTCAHNLQLPLVLQGMSPRQARSRVHEFLKDPTFADLQRDQGHFGREVSGGQRQRFAVLRAIIHNPQVVFADEPVSNLDAKNSQGFRQLLQKWVKNQLPLLPARGPRTLVLVCHDEAVATELADQFLILLPGEEGATNRFVDNRLEKIPPSSLRLLIQGDDSAVKLNRLSQHSEKTIQ